MKKIFTIAVASLALVASVHADKVKILSCGLGIPGIDEPQLMGLGISADGRFVCGAIEGGLGYFVANAESGDIKYNMAGDDGGELRHVDNNGLAIGFSDFGITYNIADGKETELVAPEGYKYVLGESVTNDGSILIGSLVGTGFVTEAVYSTDGVEWKRLPMPSQEELGVFYPKYDASAAKQISADGKVILGTIGSFSSPILWYRNDAGEYEYDFFPARIVKATDEDIDNPDKELYGLGAFYMNMSNDGRYVVLIGGLKNDDDELNLINVPVVYDTQEKKLTIYSDIDVISPGSNFYPSAICNDGTFIGSIGQPSVNASGAFIMRAGETRAERFIDAFPEFDDKLGEGDSIGFNVPCGISADGQYIMGYTYYCDNYMDPNADAYYVTYIIDTKAEYGVEEITAETAAPTPVEYYSIDGNRVNEDVRGIRLVRYSDGSVRKEVKR